MKPQCKLVLYVLGKATGIAKEHSINKFSIVMIVGKFKIIRSLFHKLHLLCSLFIVKSGPYNILLKNKFASCLKDGETNRIITARIMRETYKREHKKSLQLQIMLSGCICRCTGKTRVQSVGRSTGYVDEAPDSVQPRATLQTCDVNSIADYCSIIAITITITSSQQQQQQQPREEKPRHVYTDTVTFHLRTGVS